MFCNNTIFEFKNSIISKKDYLKTKTLYDEKRNDLIKNIRKIIGEADKSHTYYLGGVEMIANDVINFVKKDIIVFSISVVLIIIFVLYLKHHCHLHVGFSLFLDLLFIVSQGLYYFLYCS